MPALTRNRRPPGSYHRDGEPDYLPDANRLHSSVEVRGAEPGSHRPVNAPTLRRLRSWGLCCQGRLRAGIYAVDSAARPERNSMSHGSTHLTEPLHARNQSRNHSRRRAGSALRSLTAACCSRRHRRARRDRRCSPRRRRPQHPRRWRHPSRSSRRQTSACSVLRTRPTTASTGRAWRSSALVATGHTPNAPAVAWLLGAAMRRRRLHRVPGEHVNGVHACDRGRERDRSSDSGARRAREADGDCGRGIEALPAALTVGSTTTPRLVPQLRTPTPPASR